MWYFDSNNGKLRALLVLAVKSPRKSKTNVHILQYGCKKAYKVLKNKHLEGNKGDTRNMIDNKNTIWLTDK